MSDIDFDELDKAVNNIMSNAGRKNKKQDQADGAKDEDTVGTQEPERQPADNGLKDNTEQVVTTPEEPAAPEATEAPKTPSIVGTSRPRQNPGRFMDVVHPSGDKRSAAGVPPTITSPRAAPISPNDLVESDPQTPFLPDANEKVDKRPLGAVAWPFGRSADEKSEDTAPTNNINESKPEQGGDDSETASPVSETSVINNDEKPEHKEQRGLDEPAPDPTHIDTKQTDEERKLQLVESAENADLPLTDGSIELIQQVESGDTEKLRSGQEGVKDNEKQITSAESVGTNGAIYDVKDYHQPLNRGDKQKSGWGTVIIVVSIIVICIAIAAAVYFFVVDGSL